MRNDLLEKIEDRTKRFLFEDGLVELFTGIHLVGYITIMTLTSQTGAWIIHHNSQFGFLMFPFMIFAPVLIIISIGYPNLLKEKFKKRYVYPYSGYVKYKSSNTKSLVVISIVILLMIIAIILLRSNFFFWIYSFSACILALSLAYWPGYRWGFKRSFVLAGVSFVLAAVISPLVISKSAKFLIFTNDSLPNIRLLTFMLLMGLTFIISGGLTFWKFRQKQSKISLAELNYE